ncbi:hypothetical protein [Flavobacterium aurantiibacter]|uniref:hypothetical protein n=1 Tax=Flavobacterium aurantiibacter TaxID=2023067 RepID=UPI0010565F5D|nr:hypothetical protein [Flavobacterium aurantiibacter]
MNLFSIIQSDLKHYRATGFTKFLLVVIFNQSFRLLLNYRLGNYLAQRRNFIYNLLILFLKRRQIRRYSCDIAYSAKIGKNISFPHPIGIVIGTNTEIGDYVMIWQHVTFGSKGAESKVYP